MNEVQYQNFLEIFEDRIVTESQDPESIEFPNETAINELGTIARTTVEGFKVRFIADRGGWIIALDLTSIGIISEDFNKEWSNDEIEIYAEVVADLFLDIVEQRIGIVFFIQKQDKSTIFPEAAVYQFYYKRGDKYYHLATGFKSEWEVDESKGEHYINVETERLVVLDVNSEDRPSASSVELIKRNNFETRIGQPLISSIPQYFGIKTLEEIRPIKQKIIF